MKQGDLSPQWPKIGVFAGSGLIYKRMFEDGSSSNITVGHVAGKSLTGLLRFMVGTDDFRACVEMALKGDRTKVD